MTAPGMTVVLTPVRPAWDEDGRETKISGLFDVVEHMPCEPSNYVWSPLWVVAANDEMFTVDADTFFEQTDPKAYGRALAQEREMEFAAERPS